MYEIKIFENPDFGQVRTTTGENGAPFFCAVDVCRALGYGNSRDALRKHVMEDDVAKRDTIDSLGRKQQTSFINVTACDDSILIRDLAKLITQNGINIGQNRLFYWLRLNGYLFKRETRPIQKWVEQGLFETSVSLIETHHGTMERCTTKVTGKGQQYFVNGFVTGRFKADNQNL